MIMLTKIKIWVYNQYNVSHEKGYEVKDKVTLETLRAVKAELLKIQTTTGASSEISRVEEIVP